MPRVQGRLTDDQLRRIAEGLVEERSYREIAAEVGCAHTTVKRLVDRDDPRLRDATTRVRSERRRLRSNTARAARRRVERVAQPEPAATPEPDHPRDETGRYVTVEPQPGGGAWFTDETGFRTFGTHPPVEPVGEAPEPKRVAPPRMRSLVPRWDPEAERFMLVPSPRRPTLEVGPDGVRLVERETDDERRRGLERAIAVERADAYRGLIPSPLEIEAELLRGRARSSVVDGFEFMPASSDTVEWIEQQRALDAASTWTIAAGGNVLTLPPEEAERYLTPGSEWRRVA